MNGSKGIARNADRADPFDGLNDSNEVITVTPNDAAEEPTKEKVVSPAENAAEPEELVTAEEKEPEPKKRNQRGKSRPFCAQIAGRKFSLISCSARIAGPN